MSPFVCNNDWFNGLDDATKQLVMDAVTLVTDHINESYINQEEEFLQKLEAEGMIVNDIAPEAKAEFVEAVQPLYDEYRQVWDPALFEIVDAILAQQ